MEGSRFILSIFIFLSFSIGAQTLDTGTGADGNCDQDTFTTATTYNCLTVTITGAKSISSG